MGKNIIIFGVDMSPSVHIDGRNKNILVLGEGPKQGLNNATPTAEAEYPINFIESGKGFVLSQPYNSSNNFLLFNTVKICQFKAKHSEIKPYPLCLGNISKDFTLDNMKKNRIKRGCVGFFS